MHPDTLFAGFAETIGIAERFLDLGDRGLVVPLLQIAETEQVAAVDELGLTLVVMLNSEMASSRRPISR